MAGVLVELKGVTKLYNKEKALDNVTFVIPEGKVTALIGPNGAGKTTLIKILLSLIDCDRGQVKFHKNIKFSYAPEECRLYPELTVRYFLKWLAKVKKISLDVLNNYIEKFKLSDYLDKRIKTLSKGYKRRLLVLQALLGDENLVVLDEPSDGLDIEFKFKLRDILKAAKKDKTFLICSHESLILNDVADRIVILDRGRKRFEGEASQLKAPDGKLYIEDIYFKLVKK